MLLMWTWVRGSRILFAKEHKETIPLVELLDMLERSNPYAAPGALMHNLKHNTVIHERNVIFTVKTLDQPYARQDDQFEITVLNNCFTRVIVRTGYMEPPRVPRLLNQLRRRGLEFELMKTSFFLGRRSLKVSPRGGMPLWQDHLFIAMARSATSASDYFHIPNGRVVELGSQISV